LFFFVNSTVNTHTAVPIDRLTAHWHHYCNVTLHTDRKRVHFGSSMTTACWIDKRTGHQYFATHLFYNDFLNESKSNF